MTSEAACATSAISCEFSELKIMSLRSKSIDGFSYNCVYSFGLNF